MNSCILTVIKNEHQYLDEWIKYHLDLGVDHIFIFEDIDSDSHKDICDKYGDSVSLNSVTAVLDENDIKTVKELKETKRNNPQYIYIKKGLIYIQCLLMYDWCFVIDNDEYITFENKESKLDDILALYNNYDAFIMQWECYGANGYINKPDYKDNGIVGTYTEKIKGYVPTKSLASYTKTCYNVRKYKPEFFWYTHQPSNNCNFCRTNFSKDRYGRIYDTIFIRHYITKSWEEYVWKQTKRGYLFGKIRNLDFFFEVNPDMKDKKEKLINELKKEILVVLPYKQKGSQGTEIRVALNGWRKFCQFKYNFIVVGTFDSSLKDEFPWVEFINSPAVKKKEGQYNQHLDVQHCMEIVMKKYDKFYDGFIWMVDDNYAIKPFELSDITSVHYHNTTFIGNEKSPKSFWNYDKWKTRQLLDKEKLPHYNYTTHYPCYFEFNKLKKIWDKYNMSEESYVLEDVYFNYFKHEEPMLDSTIRLGIWSNDIFKNEFQKAVDNPNIKFMCNSVEGWSKELEDKLWEIVK